MKRASKVDFDKDKDIPQLKQFLYRKRDLITDLHYNKGYSIHAIFMEIQKTYKKRVCFGKWMKEKNQMHLYELMKPQLRDYVFSTILKYSNWEEYKKNLVKLIAKARSSHGFTAKLKKEIKIRDENRCQMCRSINQLEVHHIDGNPLNNDPENLITICKRCHQKDLRTPFIEKRLKYLNDLE